MEVGPEAEDPGRKVNILIKERRQGGMNRMQQQQRIKTIRSGETGRGRETLAIRSMS